MKPYKGLYNVQYEETDEGINVTLIMRRLKEGFKPFRVIANISFLPLWIVGAIASNPDGADGADALLIGFVGAVIIYGLIMFLGALLTMGNKRKVKLLFSDKHITISNRKMERANLSEFRVWGTQTHNNLTYDILSIDHELSTIRLGHVFHGKGHNIVRGLNQLALEAYNKKLLI